MSNPYPKYPDEYYVGKKHNKLEILEVFRLISGNGRQHRYVRCLCECGNITSPELHSVLKGSTKSCGCYKKQILPIIHKLSPANKKGYKKCVKKLKVI